MSLDDVFGTHPGRPQHPDFRVLVNVVLKQDGKTEDPDFNYPDYVNTMIDTDSAVYMAQQRCRKFADQLGQPSALPALWAAWMDGFTIGVEYDQAKGKIG